LTLQVEEVQKRGSRQSNFPKPTAVPVTKLDEKYIGLFIERVTKEGILFWLKSWIKNSPRL